ncbi:MAG: hypothetical protein AB8G17_04655 [Gammaproteobacteria bacterium]
MNWFPLSQRTAACLTLTVLAGCSDTPPTQDATPIEQTDTSITAPAPPKQAPEPAQPESAQTQFFKRLAALCGNAYAGYLTVGTEDSDRAFGESSMTMHVRDCDADEIRIPFSVGENRSRTWVVRRLDSALTLHHRHVDQSGASEDPDRYGGQTQNTGSATRQEFVVDDATKAQLPATKYNVWAIEVRPGKTFAYELQRPEEERFFRVEFDLDQPIETPPPAWGESG